ncbi:phytoene desaturase family protein [Massilibacteroides vaginae]|uniref:phytoene desaturase family protein n=1 Tax=Massilibacteroides vaginae TaxID=1673718 RepID=UPI000A1CA2A3|nr:NAD(P)/FAD-dependent oxidoreductase [Massilibacteroides vaginae]
MKYDVVIIGSGLSGLICATTLSKEGFNVCVLEKNPLAGGCFQSFKRNGRVLDTGIHYVGSLDEGEVLRQYFNYFGIMDKLQIKRLDETGFDLIHFRDHVYSYAIGHERFIETLVKDFPQEREALIQYTNRLKQIGYGISLSQLKSGKLSSGDISNFHQSAWEEIYKTTSNDTLRQVLTGTAMLYAGDQNVSNFYHHAMINNSYIQGAYRFVNGSQQVADALIEEIKQNGGTVRCNANVTHLGIEDKLVNSVEINGEESISAKYVISSLHPAVLTSLLEKTNLIRKAYISRMQSLSNSYGFFSAYLIQKPGTTPYLNHNIYIHGEDNAWYASKHKEDKRINTCMVSMQASALSEKHTEVIYLLSPMYFDEVSRWTDTDVEQRGDEYKEFKARKAEELIRFVERYYPGLCQNTQKIYTATPLTYRDYTGTPEGSAYGIIKDYKNPLATLVSSRTRITNLLQTGQNLNVHGALGVTLTAMLTCSELLGKEYLAKKVSDA